MKIGFEAKRVYHNTTGLGNYGRDLIRSLTAFYPQNHYFLYNPKKRHDPLFTAENPIVVEKLPSNTFYRRFHNYWRQKGIINDLLKDEITVFHGLSGELPFGLKKRKIKSVVTIHDLIFVRYPKLYSFFDRQIHFFKFRKAAKNADIVVAISEQTKQDIIEFLKIDADKIKVIYQSCHSAFKKEYASEEKEAVRLKYNLPENFILNVGTLEERKNIFPVVKAIRDIDTTLVLVGKETSYSDAIKKYIKEYNLEERVFFLKHVEIEELAMLYQLATLFVYPSLFEGFGIPIIEALYSKTPVITTNYGVFPEVGGPASVYIDPSDVNALKEKIKWLNSNDMLRAQIIEEGYAYVQKFSDIEIARQMMALYKSI